MPQHPVACQPSRRHGQRCDSQQCQQILSCKEVVIEFHLALELPRACIRKQQAYQRGHKAQHGELNGKDGCDARTRCAQRLQHDYLTNAPVSRTCNGGR